MSYYRSREFYLEVARGNVPGHALVEKFGAASLTTSLTPVSASGFYRTPTAAAALEFLSSSANDAAAGSGAREISVQGLDTNWAEVTQTLVPNGVTPVALGTNLLRLYRWWVSPSGTYADPQGSGSHAGDLTIRASGGGVTWSTISASPYALGQSEIGWYTIPDTVTGWIPSVHVTPAAAQAVNVLLMQRPEADDVAAAYAGTMRLVKRFQGLTAPTSFLPSGALGPFTGPCDVGFMAQTTAGTGSVSVDFELLLIDDGN